MADSPSDDPLARAQKLYENKVDPKSNLEIIKLLEQPGGDVASEAYRMAQLAIAEICDYLNRWNDAGPEEVAKAKANIQTALAADPDPALAYLAYYARGLVHRAEGQHGYARFDFAKASQFNPAFARAYAQKGAENLYLGEPEKALADILQGIARELRPHVLAMFYWLMGRTHFFMQNYETAIPWLQQSIKGCPDLWYNRLYLVSAYAQAGDIDSARQALSEFNEWSAGYTLERVIENEKTNPNENPFVVEGRRRFHEGLLAAGMPPA
ncbi:MAG TPA: tetratricopeptide repeat protein [Stellaceae bacterium]|nr:tetratricopeptide repeat protein [Stellaceae bacterium]